MGRPFRALFVFCAKPWRCLGLAWFAPLVLESSRTPTVHEHATKAMKPAATKLPKSVKFGFIALEFAVLALSAFYVFAPTHFDPNLGLLQMVLMAMLLMSSCLLLRRERRLAIYGFLVFVISVFMGFSIPVF